VNVYVATKYENWERAAGLAAQLEAAGHVVTYKWWEAGPLGRAEAARRDMRSVLAADALLLVVERELRYSGALTELGMALAAGIDVYVLGDAVDNIFLELPQVRRGAAGLGLPCAT